MPLWWICTLLISLTWTSIHAYTAEDIDGWKVYRERLYKYNGAGMFFDKAKESCESLGGVLATTEDGDRNAFVRSLVIGTKEAWFGLVRNTTTMEFYFLSGVPFEDTSYNNWKAGQPNDYRKKEDCVRLEKYADWNDYRCDRSYKSICEKDAPGLWGSPCPPGWEVIRGYCYYRPSETTRYYEDADNFCYSLGASSFCYSDQEERDNLRGTFKSSYWIGMADRRSSDKPMTDGSYRCIDGIIDPHVDWKSGHPNCASTSTSFVFDNVNGMESKTSTKIMPMCKKLACPYGWRESDGNCYNVGTNAVTIEEAKSNCEMHGAVIGTPTSVATNIMFMEMAKNQRFWLGIEIDNGNLERSDGLSYTYTYWLSEPLVDDKLCTQLQSDGSWLAGNCSGEAGYICAQINAVPDYRLMRGFKFTNYTIDTYDDLTLAECAARCTAYHHAGIGRRCYSFDYNPSTGQCVLNKNQYLNIWPERDHVRDNEWNHYDSSDDVCDVPPERKITPAYGLGAPYCRSNGFCGGSNCYYPLNQLYESVSRQGQEQLIRRRRSMAGGEAGTSKEAAVECPPGWMYFQSTCYKLFPSSPYIRSLDTCRREAAHLVTVESEEHMTFIYQNFIQGNTSIWLGLRNIVGIPTQSWGEWIDGKESDVRMWDKDDNEPSDGAVNSVVTATSNGFWNNRKTDASASPLCSKSSCPKGWKWINENCYRTIYMNVIHSDAESDCQANNAVLAIPVDAEQNNNIMSAAGGESVWLGYHLVNDAWQRSDGWPVSYENWSDGAPGGEFCVTMDSTGSWTTQSCQQTLPYICVKNYHLDGFRVSPGAYIKGMNNAIINDTTAYECGQKCLQYMSDVYEAKCLSFEFDTKQNICYLSDRNQETIVHEYDWHSHPDSLYYEREFEMFDTIDTTGCVFPFNIDGTDYNTCDHHNGYEDRWTWCSITDDFTADKQRRWCQDSDACSIDPEELVDCPGGDTLEKCLYAGCCWIENGDGSNKNCFASKSSQSKLTCNDGCKTVYDAVMTGDEALIEHTFYESAFDDAKRVLEDLPSSFWDFLEQHPDVKRSLLSVSWPIDAQMLENFYELYEHVGEARAASYYHLLIATAHNRREIGIHTRSHYFVGPGEFGATESVSRLEQERWSTEQNVLMDENEDENVAQLNDQQQRRRRRSVAGGVQECTPYAKYEWYSGHKNTTQTGLPCQKWILNYPQEHSYHDPAAYPDETVEDALNYCRNPNKHPRSSPWCFIDDPNGERWDYCGIPECDDTKQFCKFPFVSPYTNVTWHRCAFEFDYDSSQFCLDEYGTKFDCVHDYTDENVKDDGCVFPFTWEETGETYDHCIGENNPWCASIEAWVPEASASDYKRNCLDDYGLGHRMFTWESVLEDPVLHRDFKLFADSVMSKCDFETVDEIPFPPRDIGPNAFESLDFFIEKYENSETNPYFNLFPTFTAEWPALLHLIMDIPISECEWLWKRWTNNENIITYTHYSKKQADPEIYCRPREWSPASLPYYKEEGGVCGQQSAIAKYSYICLGKPANILRQPGHAAMFAIHHHPLETDFFEGPYKLRGQQWQSDGDYESSSGASSPNVRHTQTLSGQPASRIVNLDFERSIVYSLNQGYENFTQGWRALNILNRLDDIQKENILPYIVNSLEKNPYQSHTWHEIADFLTGKRWKVGETKLIYSQFCRDVPNLDNLRTRLAALANTAFLEKRMYINTYITAMTRIVFPASCCAANPDYKNDLQMVASDLDSWSTKYADVVRMHYIKCESVEGSLDDSAREILGDMLSTTGTSTDTAEKQRFVSFFEVTMKLFTDIGDIITFCEHMSERLPRVEVGTKTWALALAYDHLTRKLIELYNENGQDGDAAGLQAYKDNLVDKANGGDMNFWQNLADENYLIGSYQPILDRTKQWNSAKEIFE